MKKKYKLLIFCTVLIFSIFLLKTFFNFNNNEIGFLGDGYEDYMSVGVYEVKKDNISKYITSSSQITSFNISEITLDDMENVKECYVKDGSSVKKNQKLLKTTIGNYLNRTIKSEISGKFFIIHEEDGNKIYRVYDTSKTGVMVKIKENQINNIKIGEKAIVSLINSDEVYEGKITYVSQIPNSDGKFNVEITIPYEKNIKYGYTANVKIEADSNKSSILIPYEAINVDDESGDYFVVKEEYKEYFESNTLTEDMKIYIETGIFGTDNVEVKNGLEEGMKILYWK